MWEENRKSYRFESSSPLLNNRRVLQREFIYSNRKADREKNESHKYYKREREFNMVSRELKRAALHEKLQVLRSITYSHAVNSLLINSSPEFFAFIESYLLMMYILSISCQKIHQHNPI